VELDCPDSPEIRPRYSRETTVTDPRGTKRVVQFDRDGLPIRDVQAAGTPEEQVTVVERDSANHGRVVRVTDALGRVTEPTHDVNNNVVAVKSLAGTAEETVTRATYDTATNLPLTLTDPAGSTTRFAYDDRHRLTSVTDPTGRATRYGYEGRDGQPTSLTTPDGAVTRFGYVDGDLRWARDPLGNETRQYVDALGRVTAVTDALNRTTRFDLDDAGLVRRVVDPAGRETMLGYDANGNATSVTDPRGTTTRATYDALDELLSLTDALGRVETVERDGNGNVIRTTDRKGQVHKHTYDALDRLTGTDFGTESRIAYAYDRGDRLIRLDDSSSGEISRRYDGLGRLVEEVTPQGTLSYGYDAAGRRTSMKAPDQADTAYRYDAAGRLTAVEQGALSATFAFDAGGRRVFAALPNGIEQRLAYDGASRVVGVEYLRAGKPAGDVRYAYDPAGRRTAAWGSLAKTLLPAPVSEARYDAANRLVEQDGRSFAYDAEGNLLDDGDARYAWNARGELTGLTRGTATARFAYDAVGRRTSRTVGDATTTFLHDGANVAQERPDSGPRAVLMNGVGLDTLLARTTDGAVATPLVDGLGTTVAVARADGALDALAYGPFGEVAGAPADFPHQFTGRENDGSGLLFYRARYYSPAQKRFISEDPLGAAGSGHNLYAYASGDPINRIDPTGMVDVIPSTQQVGDFMAGFGDTVSCGITNGVREGMGTNGVVSKSSGSYGLGAVAGEVFPLGKATKVLGKACGAGGAAPTRSAKNPRANDLPARGKPNSTDARDDGQGNGQIRDYGDDGRAKTDFDFAMITAPGIRTRTTGTGPGSPLGDPGVPSARTNEGTTLAEGSHPRKRERRGRTRTDARRVPGP